MDGGIAEKFGYLGKILVLLPDKLLGIFDLHLAEKVDYPTVILLPE